MIFSKAQQLSLIVAFIFSSFLPSTPAFAQCGTAGDQVTYGANSWIGYVYGGQDNFTANYQGFITEPQNFNEEFNGDNGPFAVNTSCSVASIDFSVRFKMRINLACGTYQFTMGGDDGVRLSIDGGATFLMSDYSIHGYRTTSTTRYLAAGTYDFVLEYFEWDFGNRVSFSSSFLAPSTGGAIANDQTVCGTTSTTIDPAAFTSVSPAQFCSGNSFAYQWESSLDNSNWNAISGANADVYDIPSGFPAGTRYFRRRATDNGNADVIYSNTLTVTGQAPLGDQTTYGTGATPWIGYVYSGLDNFSNNYLGYITEPSASSFDENFGCQACTIAINGCNLFTDNFSVRFKSRQTLACGNYEFTVGGDDGYRLSIDGGTTFLLSNYAIHGYQTTSATVFLPAGTYDFVLEYFDWFYDNRVSFSSTLVGLSTGGSIANGQTVCGTTSTTIDPAAFTSVSPAQFCSGNSFTYQWESSPDNSNWNAIAGANAVVYDIPLGFPLGTQYFRRKATDNGNADVVYSNTLRVSGQAPQGDQTTYGTGATPWIGYVYSGADNFSNNYLGYITEPTASSFDENFGCRACTIAINGCDLFTDNFSVRFKSRQTLACGNYEFTVGGDDGYRLSIDGGVTFLTGDYSAHSFRTSTVTIYLPGGTYDFVLEYFELNIDNRVTFSSTVVGNSVGGEIGSSQTLCNAGTIDPAGFTNITAAAFCTGTISYQWQESTDNIAFTNISGATAIVYDIPAGFPTPATRYYRRSATNGVTTEYSNTVTVTSTGVSGDEITYGSGSWIGYVYDGVNNYSSANYQGSFTESSIFDEPFCGDNCNFNISGCPLYTETFTVRFRMRITLPNAGYTFTIGGDDGVRLSIDGGNTFLLSDYSDHGYRTISSGVTNLNGTYDLVLEYYENGGGNRVSFSYSAGPLPVSLTEFQGKQIDEHNVLEWVTASEKNSEGFYVERSIDARKFESLGWVAGNGTTTERHEYTFVDESPMQGTNYYRLNQKDFDGRQEYSKVISINYAGEAQIKLFPNPSKGDVTILYSTRSGEAAYLQIIDGIKGGSVNCQIEVSQGKLLIKGLSPGFYVAQIKLGLVTTVRKILVIP